MVIYTVLSLFGLVLRSVESLSERIFSCCSVLLSSWS